ncbi:MAG: PEPxxWA-CTERM sorting domain-containing protein [Polymorphobacter sp.]
MNVTSFADVPFIARAVYDFDLLPETISGSTSTLVGETFMAFTGPLPFSASLAFELDDEVVALGFVHDVVAMKTNALGGDSLAFQVSHFRIGGGEQNSFGFDANFAASAELFQRSSFLEHFTYTTPDRSAGSFDGSFSRFGFDGFGNVATWTAFTATGPLTFSIAAVGAPGAVPEPASWALLLAGFGIVGGALRRRHAAGSPAVRAAAR